MQEPDTPASRACSTLHMAPAASLQASSQPAEVRDAPRERPSPEPGDTAAASLAADPADPNIITPEQLDDVAAALRASPDALAEFIERLSPDPARRDGWSPFARKLFLKVVAENGGIALACRYVGMSRESAYALRNRDPLFAAGWDAACLMARNRLADHMYEQAMDGVTDTITRNGEVIATRHRFDTRLSIAVLNRLDRRCDRAEELGSNHLAVAARWDDYLDCIGRADDEAARALVEGDSAAPAEDCEKCQLPETANPLPADELDDLFDHVWKAGSEGDPNPERPEPSQGTWMTCFAPPAGFEGYQNREHDGDHYYERSCTGEEVRLIEAYYAAAAALEQAENAAFAESQRDTFFGALRLELKRFGEAAALAARAA